MSRLVIDITQLVRWQGRLTGIPRVMNEFARRFTDNSVDEVVFVEWDSPKGVLLEVGEDELWGRRQKNVEVLNQPLAASRGGAKQRIKGIARRVYSVSPEPAKKLARNIKGSLLAQQGPVEGFSFEGGDKLFVLWGEWSDESYRHYLLDVVTNTGVHLYQMVYDMLPLVTPQYSSHSTEGLTHYVNEVYPLCEKLISISEYTKKDLVEWLTARNLRVPEIEVIRLGEDFVKAQVKQPEHEFFTTKLPYIVCVGTIESRKNHTLLYYSYKLAKARAIELPKLVIVGRRGWLTENIYELMINDPETKDSFVFLHDASDEELSWLYENALFSIYPSHYEGWGLPVAESLVHGVPSIASNTSSIPEIAGDLIQYFSPNSTDECLAAIQHLLKKDNLKDAKQKAGRYHSMSWDETFEQIKGIIEGDGK